MPVPHESHVRASSSPHPRDTPCAHPQAVSHPNAASQPQPVDELQDAVERGRGLPWSCLFGATGRLRGPSGGPSRRSGTGEHRTAPRTRRGAALRSRGRPPPDDTGRRDRGARKAPQNPYATRSSTAGASPARPVAEPAEDLVGEQAGGQPAPPARPSSRDPRRRAGRRPDAPSPAMPPRPSSRWIMAVTAIGIDSHTVRARELEARTMTVSRRVDAGALGPGRYRSSRIGFAIRTNAQPTPSARPAGSPLRTSPG